jgi:hypothetical protein
VEGLRADAQARELLGQAPPNLARERRRWVNWLSVREAACRVGEGAPSIFGDALQRRVEGRRSVDEAAKSTSEGRDG